jgi:hypothetical protein
VLWLVGVVRYLDDLLFRQWRAPPNMEIALAEKISNPNLRNIG